MMLSSTVSEHAVSRCLYRAQRRTLNDTACYVPRMSGLFLDTWPLSHYTAGKDVAQSKVKKMYL